MPTYTPPPTGTVSVLIRPNTPEAEAAGWGGAFELAGSGAVRMQEFNPPVPTYDEAYVDSEYTEGAKRYRSRPQNPEGSGKLFIHADDSTTYASACTEVQQAFEAVRKYGGQMRWTPADGDAITYDVESIRLTSWPVDILPLRTFPEFSFTTHPLGKLDDITLVSNATSSEPVLTTTLSDITGSADALLSVKVTDTASHDRDHVEIGLDELYDPTSSVLIDSSSLSTSGLAGGGTIRSGAYSGGSVIRGTLAGLPQGICEATSLTQVGKHRAKARVYASGTGQVRARVAWRVGSGPWNRGQWQDVTTSQFSEVDFGLMRIPTDATATTTRVEAKSETTGDTFDVDYLEVFPASKWSKLRAPENYSQPAAVSYYDQFNSGGTLNGKAPTIGSGTWTETSAGKFVVDSTYTRVQSLASTGGTLVQAYLGSGFTDAAVSADLTVWLLATSSANSAYGCVLYRQDASHYIYAGYLQSYETSGLLAAKFATYLFVYKTVSGSPSTVYQELLSTSTASQPVSGNVSLTTKDNGRWSLAVDGDLRASGNDSDLAGFTSGPVGLGYSGTSATYSLALFDNFSAWVPPVSHACNSGSYVTVDHQSARRADAGRPPSVEGNYLTCPPSGREDREFRLAVKARRNDVDTLADDQISDGLRVDVTATPRVVVR